MNSHKPLISVIIPAYNHQLYIAGTIKSIMSQSYDNIELLIIDDGSTDKTWEVIQSFSNKCKARFAHVSFQTQENAGTCETLNRLIDLAKGEYIYLIASDDLAKPHALATLEDFLAKNQDYSLVVGDNEFINGQGKQIYWDKNNQVDISSDKKFITFGTFLQHTKHNINFHSSDFGTFQNLVDYGNHVPNGYLIRKSMLDTIGPFTKKAPLEDYYLMLQLAKHTKLKYLDEVLFSYRWHKSNTSHNKVKMYFMTWQTLNYVLAQA